MAESAYKAGAAHALNYTADDAVHPTEFKFAGGIIVRATTNRHTGPRAELTIERV